MIKRTTCPFLGLKDDPTTALNYPSEGNFCHHARPIAPVNGNYQQQYCLSADHTACPIFLAAQPQPLPVALTAPSYLSTKPKRILAIFVIPFLLAGTAALAMAWNVFSSRAGATGSMPVTGMNASGNWSLLVTGTPRKSISAPTSEPSAQPLKTECPLPTGWQPYRINPTDSLYRLSVIYGVPVEQLQQVNCLDDQTVVFPGQMIYVPNIPTDTPFPTITPVTVFPTSTPKPPEQNNEPPPPPKPSEEPLPAAQPSINEPVPVQPAVKPSPNNPAPDQPSAKPANNGNSGKKDPGIMANNGGKAKEKAKAKENNFF